MQAKVKSKFDYRVIKVNEQQFLEEARQQKQEAVIMIHQARQQRWQALLMAQKARQDKEKAISLLKEAQLAFDQQMQLPVKIDAAIWIM